MTWRMTFYPLRTVGLPVYKFDSQRATCERCAHYAARTGPTGTTLTCGFTKNRKRTTCSASRSTGGACGPDAAGFRERLHA